MTVVPAAPGISISTVCLAGTLEDKLRAASEAGFAGVELLEYDLVMSPWSPRRLAEEAARLSLSIEAYQPFHVEALPPDRFGASLRHAERKFDLMEDLGARVLVCCSSKTAHGLDDDDLAAEQLDELADRAARRGLRLAFEAVPWGRLRTHDDAWRIVRQVDHPALGLCLDSFHVLSIHNDPDVIADVAADKIFHVQLADAPRPNMDVREWSLHSRLFPGQGSLDVAGFLGRILSGGYAGPIALEVFNDVYQQEDPRHAATDAMRSMRALTETVAGRHAQDGRGIRLRDDLPPAPGLDGYAFVELAVDEVSGPLVSHALTA
ncbi:MAG: 4-hydroxyphenylpyruvate dioxygenase, partial [Microbacterium sp.]|nr:4-hydroxyphenylpyruvate dioxygenase [Microbacterium sp.]